LVHVFAYDGDGLECERHAEIKSQMAFCAKGKRT
jgi:hypothetical protein